jgi:hypothetical protein
VTELSVKITRLAGKEAPTQTQTDADVTARRPRWTAGLRGCVFNLSSVRGATRESSDV